MHRPLQQGRRLQLHRPQDQLRRGRRARLPALFAGHRIHRGGSPRRRPPREAYAEASYDTLSQQFGQRITRALQEQHGASAFKAGIGAEAIREISHDISCRRRVKLASGRETQLTTDGVKDFGYATDNAGWTHSDRPVVTWSPDGRQIATWLANRVGVERVIYPGLPSHPQHDLARRQMCGFGGMITVDMGTRERAARVLERTRIFSLAESLGGVESLISHPATMTHASVPPDRRADVGITDGMIRLSCGVEDVSDLIRDLEQAFRDE